MGPSSECRGLVCATDQFNKLALTLALCHEERTSERANAPDLLESNFFPASATREPGRGSSIGRKDCALMTRTAFTWRIHAIIASRFFRAPANSSGLMAGRALARAS